MSKLCPLWPHSRFGCEAECLGEKCGLADETGNCLIKQFLELQVSKSSKEKETAETYWAIKKDGTRTPIVFPSSTKEVLVDARLPKEENLKKWPVHENDFSYQQSIQLGLGIDYANPSGSDRSYSGS